jgi:patatin-like phospholipase/acyl hydrolase
VRILSLRGGGIRGLAVAAFLSRLEDEAGPLSSKFDLIVGTSTGGILAIALGLGLSPKDIIRFYVEDGPAVFKRRVLHYFGLTGAKYDSNVLRARLGARFGADARMRSCTTRVMVTATNLETEGAQFIKSWKDGNVSVVSAPTSGRWQSLLLASSRVGCSLTVACLQTTRPSVH